VLPSNLTKLHILLLTKSTEVGVSSWNRSISMANGGNTVFVDIVAM